MPLPERDWWDKAEIVSSIASSVVIAAVGIAISWNLQRAQIASSEALATAQLDAERIRAARDAQIQESQLMGELLEHLSSRDATRREVAIRALNTAVDTRSYEGILSILARVDPDSTVRIAALERLATAVDPASLQFVTAVARDRSRSVIERATAKRTAQMVAIRAGLGPNTFVYGAASDYAAMEDTELGHGVFTHFMNEGLRGHADFDTDGMVTAGELGAYLSYEVSSRNPQQQPVFVATGGLDTPLTGGQGAPASVDVLAIGISEYAGLPSLQFPVKDAQLVLNSLREAFPRSELRVTSLMNREATLERTRAALETIRRRVGEDRFVVVYFGGHGNVDSSGGASWILNPEPHGPAGAQPRGPSDERRRSGSVDGGPNTDELSSIPLNEIKNILRKIPARAKLLAVDASFAFPLPQ